MKDETKIDRGFSEYLTLKRIEEDMKMGVGSNTTQKLQSIIDKQEEYIGFLEENIKIHAVFLDVHGQIASQEVINKGRILREQISKLKE